MRIRFIASLVLGLLCFESGAQSLPDVARRERRREVAEGRVYTNENVASGGSVSAADNPTEIDSDAPPIADSATTDEVEGEGGGEVRTEEIWRQMFGEARDELTRSQERLELTEQQLTDLSQRLLTDSDFFNNENILGPAIQTMRDQLVVAEARVEAANQAITDLRQELRRAGAPAGWGRP